MQNLLAQGLALTDAERQEGAPAYGVLPDQIEVLHVFTGGRDYETIMSRDGE